MHTLAPPNTHTHAHSHTRTLPLSPSLLASHLAPWKQRAAQYCRRRCLWLFPRSVNTSQAPHCPPSRNTQVTPSSPPRKNTLRQHNQSLGLLTMLARTLLAGLLPAAPTPSLPKPLLLCPPKSPSSARRAPTKVCSLTHPHTHTLSLTLTFTHIHTHSHTNTHIHSLSQTHTLTKTQHSISIMHSSSPLLPPPLPVWPFPPLTTQASSLDLTAPQRAMS